MMTSIPGSYSRTGEEVDVCGQRRAALRQRRAERRSDRISDSGREAAKDQLARGRIPGTAAVEQRREHAHGTKHRPAGERTCPNPPWAAHPEKRRHRKNRTGGKQRKRGRCRTPSVASQFGGIDAEFLTHQRIERTLLVFHHLRSDALSVRFRHALGLKDQGEFMLLGPRRLFEFLRLSSDLRLCKLARVGRRKPFSESHRAGASRQTG